jgi:hypothetical protein
MLEKKYIYIYIYHKHLTNASHTKCHYLIFSIRTYKEYTKVVVLLISQKDYEHYIIGGFEKQVFLFLKHILSDMGTSAGQPKVPMRGSSQKELSAAPVGRPVGEYCKCNASQATIQNKTSDMIAQSRPNVK